MILCEIKDADHYRLLSTPIATAIDWLKAHVDDEFEKGRKTIATLENGDIYVNSEEPALLPHEKVKLEVHQRYIDIHVPLKGVETIGWAPTNSLKHPIAEYDSEKDVAFFGDDAHSMLNVKVGQIAVFFPEDAHAPNIGLGSHRKLCIKIPV